MRYQFNGYQPMFYNGLRDAADGHQLGYVNPGDIVDIEGAAPDGYFVPVADESSPAVDSASTEAATPVVVQESPQPDSSVPPEMAAGSHDPSTL